MTTTPRFSLAEDAVRPAHRPTTTAPPLVPDGLLTTPDVAHVFRTSESTIRYWRQQGTGPRWFKAGRRVLYDADDVRDYIQRLREDVNA